MRKLFLIFVLISSGLLFAQQKVAEYADISPNFFDDYTAPISIVVFPFTYQDFQTDLDSKFYNELTVSFDKKSRFIINFYKKLEDLKKMWGVAEWNPKDSKLLKKLESDLDIKLIVYGIVDDGTATSFQLKVIDTNGKEVFSQKYLPASNSSIISDAVKLFTENKKTVYKDIYEQGTLSVKTIPDGKFQVYLNDKYIGDTPLNKSGIQSGNYRLTVKDVGDTYQPFETSLSFFPSSYAPIEKYVVLKPNMGFLQLVLTPADANVELFNSKNNLVKMGKNINIIDSLTVGEYKLRVNKPGYMEDASNIIIQKNIAVKKEVKLLPETSRYYTVNSIECKSDFARSVTLKRNGNKYTITFDVVGGPNDNFEIELYLMDKSNKDFERELEQLTGTFGEGKFYGAGKSIVWDFEKEIKGGLDNYNLYLKLVVDKAGGGIPWYVWAGSIAAGSAVAVLLTQKKSGENNTGGTTQVTIPLPPARPGE